MKSSATVFSISLCVLALILTAGCGKVAQKASEKALEAALSDDENQVDIKLDGKSGNFQMKVKNAEGKEQALNINASDKNGGQFNMTVTGEDGQQAAAITASGGQGQFNMTVKGENGQDQQMQIAAAPGEDGQMNMTITGEDGQQQTLTGSGDDDNFSMQMNTADGALNITGGENATIPDSFPKDVPLYPGLSLDMVQSMPAQKHYAIMGKSPDTRDKIAQWYAAQLKKQGWEEQMNMTQPQMAMLTYAKDQRSVTLIINTEDGKSAINLTTAAQ